jgi:hypothetical protein
VKYVVGKNLNGKTKIENKMAGCQTFVDKKRD